MKAQARNRESIAHLLRRHGLKPTHQRMEIAHVLFTRREHLSADQILTLVNSRYAETSKATVYNTLNLFHEHGLLRTVEADPSRAYFDSTAERHHHFYNVDTGELTDIPNSAIELTVHAALPPGTRQQDVDVVVRVRSSSL